jgi:hypothetical protein
MTESTRNLKHSIIVGEKDLEEGRFTVCRTEKELRFFFDSL